jgi:8-oxo-dGTP diphosphatase
MHSFLCTTLTKDPILKEHIAYQWLSISDLDKLDWAAADLPIVHQLMQS